MKEESQASTSNEDRCDVDPYRILFPLGTFTGALGILLWFLFSKGLIRFYPRDAHGALMYFGFFYSFVVGFLMTAVPKMTGGLRASWTEIFIPLFLVLVQIALAIRNQIEVSANIYVAQILFLLFFVLRRVLIARRVPFEGFVFLPFAFLLTFMGFFLYRMEIVSFTQLLVLGGEGFLLHLIFGLGSRLIPVISRTPGALSPHQQADRNWSLFLPPLFLLQSSYWIQIFLYEPAGILLRVFAFLYALVFLFRVFKVPLQNGVLPWTLKASCLFMILSLMAALIVPDIGKGIYHVFLISGLLQVTLLIATRVMLAHGQKSLEYELTSWSLVGVVALIQVGALARFLFQLQFQSGWFTLVWTSVIGALLWWTIEFVRTLRPPQIKVYEWSGRAK